MRSNGRSAPASSDTAAFLAGLGLGSAGGIAPPTAREKAISCVGLAGTLIISSISGVRIR